MFIAITEPSATQWLICVFLWKSMAEINYMGLDRQTKSIEGLHIDRNQRMYCQ